MVVNLNLTNEELSRLKSALHLENIADAVTHAAREYLRLQVRHDELGSLERGLGRRRGEDAASFDPHMLYP
jgi:hypothetical protein